MKRVGWRNYLKQKLRKPSSFLSVGIEFGSLGLRVSVLQRRKGKLLWVQQQHFAEADCWRELRRFVERNKLANTPCYVSLETSVYQILQLDKPQVEEGEIAQAISWSVQDLVPGEEDLVVDYFDPPVQSTGANKINVVAVPASKIERISQEINRAALWLQSISIAEMAAINLLPTTAEPILLLLQSSSGEMCLCICKDAQLYFTRRLKGYENLPGFSEDEIRMGIGDNLSVELQRSMDYFESQLRQAPIRKILLAIDAENLEALATVLRELTMVAVESLEIDLVPPAGQQQAADHYVVSLGAALTAEPVSAASSASPSERAGVGA